MNPTLDFTTSILIVSGIMLFVSLLRGFNFRSSIGGLAILDSVVNFEGESAGFFMKPVTENPLITDLGLEVLDDSVVDKFIYLNGELDKVTKLRSGCGAKSDTELGTTIYRKEIQPVNLEVFKTQCSDVFDNTVFRSQLKRGVDTSDLSDTQIEELLRNFIEPVITRDALRILFLGDTALSDANYSMIDGIYKTLATGVVSDGIVDAGALTASSFTVANILGTFETIRDARTRKLKQVPKQDQVIWVTLNIYEAYQTYLETNANLESARKKIIDGMDVITFNGVEIKPLGLVDEYLEADFSTGSPASVTNPYRVIWTAKKNHVLLLDTVSGYNQVKFWYSDDDDLNKVRVRYMMGYDYKYPELITVAGF